MKILSVGHITYDITFLTDYYPLENTKNRYHDKEEFTGGPASIAAILLGKWYEDVSIAGVVGNDEYGHKIKKRFELNNVKTDYLMQTKRQPTSLSFILTNQANGTRTIFCHTPNQIKLKPLKLDFEPDLILLDGYEYEASMKLLKEYPGAISVIDADKNTKEVVELAKLVNYLICSLDFALKVTQTKIDSNDKKTLKELYLKMESMFSNKIIITMGEKGSLYREADKIKLMPTIKVKTLDSTAAGDIFHGAFVYALIHKYSYENTIKFATLASALSVTRLGGYLSIPTLKEVKEIYEQIK